MVRSTLSKFFSSSSRSSANSREAASGTKPGPAIVAVFDKRRGQREGEEADKILAFHPQSQDIDIQKRLVGFADAAASFSSTFSKGTPVESILTKLQRWTLVEVEPSIFMMTVTSRVGPTCSIREAVLRQMLTHMHSAVCLDHGSIQALLDADSNGSIARQMLKRTVTELGTILSSDKSQEMAEAHNPLSGHFAGCPTLRVPRPVFNCLQALLSTVMTSYGGKSVHGIVVLHGAHLIWSTFDLQDTQALYQFATSSFPGHGTSWSTSSITQRKHNELKANHWRPDSWQSSGNGFAALKFPIMRNTPGIGPGQPHRQPASRFPFVALSGGEHHCLAIPYIKDDLLLLLLVNDWVDPSDETLSGLRAVIAPRASKVAEGCAELMAVYRGGHVPGYRYLYESQGTHTVQASPSVKVATLSKESVMLVQLVRSILEDQESALISKRAACGQKGHLPLVGEASFGQLGPHECREVVVGGTNGCWVTMRRSGPRRLFCVMESLAQDSLQGAADACNRFIQYNYKGLFDV